MKNKSAYIISLDYELSWGLYARNNYNYIYTNVSKANSVAKRIIEFHDKYNIPATWGIVGIAADKNRESEIEFFFNEIYKNAIETNKEEFKKIVSNMTLSHFGGIQNEIAKTKNQEIASHTYYHIFFDDFSPGDPVVKHDFTMIKKIFDELNLKMTSLIMPKNVFEPRHIKTYSDNGITCVRVNPDNFLYSEYEYKKLGKIIKLLRALDYYLPINEFIEIMPQKRNKNKIKQEKLNFTEATLFLCGASNNGILNCLSYLRYIFAVRYNIVRGKDIHIWFHPHNFGKYQNKSLYWYKKMVMYAKKLEKRELIVMKKMNELG